VLELIHSDRELAVVHKPPGMPSVPDKSGDVSALEQASRQCGHELLPVHRIDRPVGGLVVFAANRTAAAALSAQFADGTATRTYRAIVFGAPDAESGELSHLLVFDRRTNRSRAVGPESRHPDARAASLSYIVVARGDRYSLLEITLHSGRHHQIRAQLADAGMPVRGDVKYGARRGLHGRAISLYAISLAFTHPTSRARLSFEVAPTGDDLWERLAGEVRRTENREA
jgi:23S rRNA pseudouridine1911/1915/1917 synthase